MYSKKAFSKKYVDRFSITEINLQLTLPLSSEADDGSAEEQPLKE
jgi:hypothetical protein